MNYSEYITHELIMQTSKVYSLRGFRKSKKDFVKIESIQKAQLGKVMIVTGTVHLYGYKIEGNGLYCGFYDVINQTLYTKEHIKNAMIIEQKGECVYDYMIKSKKTRNFVKTLKRQK